jgi:hypothetical protein
MLTEGNWFVLVSGIIFFTANIAFYWYLTKDDLGTLRTQQERKDFPDGG